MKTPYIIALGFISLGLVSTTSFLVGLHHSGWDTDAKTYSLVFGGASIHITAGLLGLGAIFVLLSMLTVTVVMTVVATLRNRKLRTEIAERQEVQHRLQIHLQRLNLLDQITRAITDNQDMNSVFQITVRSVEDDLPADFICVYLYNPVTNLLTFNSVGIKNEKLAMQLARQPTVGQHIDSHLIYEHDLTKGDLSPLSTMLRDGGMQAMVITPLVGESGISAVIVTAKTTPNSFSSSDCEFLTQLGQHVALAAAQAETHTLLQKAYDDLRLTQESIMQQERLRALGQMASGIVHDINNALLPASLYIDSLLEDVGQNQTADRSKKALTIVRQAIDDVTKTIERMREFYRPHEPKQKFQSVNLNDMISDVIDLTKAQWSDISQNRGIVITIATELSENLPAVFGFENEIREALVNLVFNALDAMPQGGTVTFRTKMSAPGAAADGIRVALEVVDTGTGMTEDTIKHCFDPFFTTKGDRGTGLGLAMVYGIMQRINGDIEIESMIGKGTTMRLLFQIADAAAVSSISNGQVQVTHLHILVVDDDLIIVRSLQEILEHDGHLVSVAHGGQEGINVWMQAEKSKPFDVVISDLGMPKTNGRKVAQAIKAINPRTPIILLTGWGQKIEIEQAGPVLFDLILTKPPKLNALRNALKEIISRNTL